jgi:hypothetical protein
MKIKLKCTKSTPDPHQIEKQDPDPYHSEKQDPDLEQNGLEPQHCLEYLWIGSTTG